MIDEKPRNNARLMLTSGVIALQRAPALMDEMRGHFAQLGSESPLYQALFDLAESLSGENREDHARRRELLDSAEAWILGAGSFEHLILLHLARGRLLLAQGEFGRARRSLKEGVTLAHRCGFGLFSQELRLAMGRLRLAQARAPKADRQTRRKPLDLLKRAARNGFYVLSGARIGRSGPAKNPEMPLSKMAVPGTLHPGCGYLWAEADAHHLIGEVLALMGERDQALASLRKAMTLRRRLDSPLVGSTERLLVELLKPR
jgi:tetratricopeptide (TPR) repeat protein